MSIIPASEVKPIWQGERVFIIGGGPSLNRMDLRPIYDQNVIGVNNAFELGDWVDVLWALDDRWVEWNWDALLNFKGIQYYGTTPHCKLPDGAKRIERWNVDNNTQNHTGLITDRRDQIKANFSSGASAINLAIHLGAAEIILLGFDMKVVAGSHNWHGSHQHRPKDTIYVDRFIKAFYPISKDLDRIGVTCLNATPDSALDMFDHVVLEDLFCTNQSSSLAAPAQAPL
jgi:hypothetical protein